MYLLASARIATILGIPIRFHWSAAVGLLILPLWRCISRLSAGRTPDLTDLCIPLLFVLALFQMVLTHEFVHCLVAKRYGVRTDAIYMHIFGGLALMAGPKEMALKPRQEMAVFAAGPISNLCLSLTAALAAALCHSRMPANLLSVYALINLSMGCFNLLPIWPLDGGQMFRAFLLMLGVKPRASDWMTFAVTLAFAFPGCYLAWKTGDYWLLSILLILTLLATLVLAVVGLGDSESSDAAIGDDAALPAMEMLPDP